MKRNQKKNTVSCHVELYKIHISVSIAIVCRDCLPTAAMESWQVRWPCTQNSGARGLSALGHCPQQKGELPGLRPGPKPGNLGMKCPCQLSLAQLSISILRVFTEHPLCPRHWVGWCFCLGQPERRRTQRQEAGHLGGGGHLGSPRLVSRHLSLSFLISSCSPSSGLRYVWPGCSQNLLPHCFSDFSTHTGNVGVLIKCRFWWRALAEAPSDTGPHWAARERTALLPKPAALTPGAPASAQKPSVSVPRSRVPSHRFPSSTLRSATPKPSLWTRPSPQSETSWGQPAVRVALLPCPWSVPPKSHISEDFVKLHTPSHTAKLTSTFLIMHWEKVQFPVCYQYKHWYF